MKKAIALVLVILVAVSLISCGERNTSESETKTDTVKETVIEIAEETEAMTVQTTEAETLSATEAVTEPETQEQDNDTALDFYKVPKSVANNNGGLFLERDTGFYQLFDGLPRESKTSLAGIYSGASNTNLYDGTSIEIVSFGDVPIPVIYTDEKIRIYSTRNIFPLNIFPANLRGYTVSAYLDKNRRSYFLWDIAANTYEESARDGDITVSDLSGNIIEDFRDLEYGQSYRVSWYVGTEYHEKIMTANCRCYDIDGIKPIYSLEGELTTYGYAEYDISEIPAGRYIITYGAGISVSSIIIDIE